MSDQDPVPQIVGIGAVNLDYVIDAGAGDLSAAGFELGTERAATSQQIQALLDQLHPIEPITSPGGSALNTIASIAVLGADATVGYVGVAGREPAPGFRFSDWWGGLGIDTRFVEVGEEMVGMCISYTVDGRRSLLTTGGANNTIMEYLERRSQALVDYLRKAVLVHVTSFAGLADVHPLVSVLQQVRAASPRVQITCDLGALWSKPPLPAGVDELVALSDWLLLNAEEYEAHIERRGHEGPGPSVLRKRADRVDTFTGWGDSVEHRSYANPIVLGADEIVDDTGAGDAFAAGFLLSLITPGMSEADGVELGMRIAREKLAWPGLHGLKKYADIFRRFSPER